MDTRALVLTGLGPNRAGEGALDAQSEMLAETQRSERDEGIRETGTQRRTLVQFADSDPFLRPYMQVRQKRLDYVCQIERRLTQGIMTLADFASGHEYYGLHSINGEWIFREWAPNATGIWVVGDMTGWEERRSFALQRIDPEGNWEIRLPSDRLTHGDLFRLRVQWPGGSGDRIPAYTRRVVQDPDTSVSNAQVWFPAHSYRWQCETFRRPSEAPFIYEAHVAYFRHPF